MANTKKQDKAGKPVDTSKAAPADAVPFSPASSSTPDSVQPGEGAIASGADAGKPIGDVSEGAPTPALPSPEPLPEVGSEKSTLQAGDPSSGTAVGSEPPVESDLKEAADLNPVKIKVYPLRSFMDDGELRRRGGPSYLVLRQHAEELEQRGLVSRQPLEG